jgi:hypothetical protein
MVDHVSRSHYAAARDLAQREEAGTPNVVGAVALAAALEVLDRIGMRHIEAAERALNESLLEGLARVPRLRLYGSIDLEHWPRVGVASFNLAEFEHGLVAAVLNDHHNIAVRNQCFCAHPCVRALLQPELWALDIGDDAAVAQRDVARRRGMVRASLGLYTSRDDVEQLISALRELAREGAGYRAVYRIGDDGEYHHSEFVPAVNFDLAMAIDQSLDARQHGAAATVSTRPIAFVVGCLSQLRRALAAGQRFESLRGRGVARAAAARRVFDEFYAG